MQALEGVKALDSCRNAPGMFCTLVRGTVAAIEPWFWTNLCRALGQVRHAGSVTGQHTEEVLRSLGYTEEQGRDLRGQEVVQ